MAGAHRYIIAKSQLSLCYGPMNTYSILAIRTLLNIGNRRQLYTAADVVV
ncbi:uncharacterized protein METZ01_LOCUS489231 [marine metagenome]|uniref:Uncharacterized protein n=1 Tax=marine metagenome TaxID=408172 RepID=A0A383CVM7_9ZZZZ